MTWLEANTCRKDFTDWEAVRLGMTIEPLERRAAKERMLAGKKADPVDSVPQGSGKACDKVGVAIGMSR